MGLSSLPTPSESILALLLANTALTLSILKQIFRSALRLAPQIDPTDSALRSEIKPLRFGRRRPEDRRNGDCCVCIARFEPESVVNRLPCGHLFHKRCVEGWIQYGNNTCPLCRCLL